MFKRKLEALQYHQVDLDIKDEMKWRNLVVWLEDQKVRLYKIEEREELRNFISGDWPKAYQKYLKDIQCPVEAGDREGVCEWLLAQAVRLDYGENVGTYKAISGNGPSQQNSSSSHPASDDPFHHLDVNEPNFKAGLASVCLLLNIPEHYDPVTTLEAVSVLIQERLMQGGAVTADEGVDFELKNYELGFSTEDPALDEAARILRLLHVSELRDLQTQINESIVAVQTITANPKTDQKLGKVGR
ncbi:RNA transcription, translation and transport factor protein-like [Asterias rubens]|uniref:RNA transcription, translation and transport factor protein-like n=1 Tax=Asterias rubens TaxID=7604 RepID=UPI0014557247|nr:RNA transcription, translation and transport factor protein-like [Asterias rubens]